MIIFYFNGDLKKAIDSDYFNEINSFAGKYMSVSVIIINLLRFLYDSELLKLKIREFLTINPDKADIWDIVIQMTSSLNDREYLRKIALNMGVKLQS